MKIIDTLGNTPLVFLKEINNNKVYAKLEYYNPTGSIKDRASYYMLKKAWERGDINSKSTIIEPTSGNTGIGLAFVAKQLGLKAILTLPDNMSVERRQMLSAYGAELVLTPAIKGMLGAIEKAKELASQIKGSFIPMQFENTDNALAHYETTAPEVFNKVQADFIVAGVGSGGTVMGFSEYIKKNNLNCKVVGVQPKASPLLTGGVVGAHKIQGIGANFIPKLLDISVLNSISDVSDEEAFFGAKELITTFGIMGGISSGAAYMASQKIAEGIEGKNIVFIVPDNCYKYLSMNIYG